MYSLCTECSFFSKLHNLTTNKWEKKCPKIFFNFHCKSFFSVHLVQYPLCNSSDKYFNICIQHIKRECRNYRRKLTMTHSPYKITHSRKLIAKLEYYCTVQTYFYIPLGKCGSSKQLFMLRQLLLPLFRVLRSTKNLTFFAHPTHL